MNEYEQEREATIAANQALLLSLGLGVTSTKPAPVKRVVVKPLPTEPVERRTSARPKGNVTYSHRELSRRVTNGLNVASSSSSSKRNSGRTTREDEDDTISITSSTDELSLGSSPHPFLYDDGDSHNKGKKRNNKGSVKERIQDPKRFGSIPGVKVGQWWEGRWGASRDAVHA